MLVTLGTLRVKQRIQFYYLASSMGCLFGSEERRLEINGLHYFVVPTIFSKNLIPQC